jgi:hypothetical protein
MTFCKRLLQIKIASKTRVSVNGAKVLIFAPLRKTRPKAPEEIFMPVGFLTDEQRRRYGRFHGDPNPDDLARYFHLDDSDHCLIAHRRGDHNRLGFAVQLCTARYLGALPKDLAMAPAAIIAVLARQLSIAPGSFAQYVAGRQWSNHAAEIRQCCGYREFADAAVQFRLNRWLYALCWTGTDRPGVLFDRATAWLITHKVLLPGVTVLERHGARLRARVQERLWASLIRGISVAAQEKLESLLTVADGGHQSLLDRLRKGPFRRSASELVRALRRVEEVRDLGIDVALSHRVPPGRIQALARFATAAKASALQRLPEERRLATLVAFALTLEATALDDVLDLLDILITEVFSNAAKAGERARLRTIKDLDLAASQLSQACRLVLDPLIPDAELRSTIFKAVERDDLESALGRVDSLVRPPEDTYYQELQQSWRRVRRFLPMLLKIVRFGCTPAGRTLAEALEQLVEQERRTKLEPARLEIVTRAWQQYVFGQDGAIDKGLHVLLPGPASFGSAPPRSLRRSQHQICGCPHRTAERRRLGSRASYRLPFTQPLAFGGRDDRCVEPPPRSDLPRNSHQLAK